MRYLRFTAASYRGDETIKAAIGGIVDYLLSLLILGDRRNLSVELCTLLQAGAFPKLGNLGHNLLAVWVARAPSDRRMEAVHNAMYLEAGSIIYSLRSLSAEFECTRRSISHSKFHLSISRLQLQIW